MKTVIVGKVRTHVRPRLHRLLLHTIPNGTYRIKRLRRLQTTTSRRVSNTTLFSSLSNFKNLASSLTLFRDVAMFRNRVRRMVPNVTIIITRLQVMIRPRGIQNRVRQLYRRQTNQFKNQNKFHELYNIRPLVCRSPRSRRYRSNRRSRSNHRRITRTRSVLFPFLFLNKLETQNDLLRNLNGLHNVLLTTRYPRRLKRNLSTLNEPRLRTRPRRVQGVLQRHPFRHTNTKIKIQRRPLYHEGETLPTSRPMSRNNGTMFINMATLGFNNKVLLQYQMTLMRLLIRTTTHHTRPRNNMTHRTYPTIFRRPSIFQTSTPIRRPCLVRNHRTIGRELRRVTNHLD